MKLNDFVEALRRYPKANELSVYSDGGYYYSVVDADGERITPANLGVNLDLERDGLDCDEYVRVNGNVYTHTATITPSNDVRDNRHIRNVTQYNNSDTVILEGDIP